MPNTEVNIASPQVPEPSHLVNKSYLPLAIAAAILVGGSCFLGYWVGHRQGLTVVGYEADAEQLVEVIQSQKQTIENLNKNLNLAVQERDLSISNANDFHQALLKSQDMQGQAENLAVLYREIIRQRGGLSLAVQHIAIKPLPENAFEYQLDLVQIHPSKRSIAGRVELRLIQGTEVLVIPMEDDLFNFENHERLTGRWTLPKGFSPQYIEVKLIGSSEPVIRRFSWQNGQPIENQSATLSEIPQAEASAN